MKKKLAMIIAAVMLLSLTACAGGESEQPEPAQPAESDPSSAAPVSETEPTEGPFDITVIIKATDSDYWQTLLLGAEAAAAESGGTINVTTAGPPSETDIDQQVSILENAIAAEPDGIVIASTSADATVPAVEQAMGSGIPVVTIDNKLNTEQYTSFLATDHYDAAGTVAEETVALWEKNGVDPSGKSVVVISSVAGTVVNTARTEGYINRMRELVPDINVLETQYADNDISKALDIAGNLIAANPDLIGIFGDNNHMGVGIAKAIEESGQKDSIVAFAFDADDDEIAAIYEGYLNGIVVQDPYGMGYNGVLSAVEAVKGGSVEKDVVVPTTLVTLQNIEEPDVQALLYPGK